MIFLQYCGQRRFQNLEVHLVFARPDTYRRPATLVEQYLGTDIQSFAYT